MIEIKAQFVCGESNFNEKLPKYYCQDCSLHSVGSRKLKGQVAIFKNEHENLDENQSFFNILILSRDLGRRWLFIVTMISGKRSIHW